MWKDREKIKLRNKKYYIKNKEKIDIKQKEYCIKNKEKVKLRKKKYYIKNKEKNKEKNNERSRAYYIKNKEKNNERSRVYYIKNKKLKNKRCNERHKERYASDPLYKLKHCIKALFHRALKTKKTKEMLGCSYEEFKEYIESLWQPGMTWDNYAIDGWHIDHKTPLTWFDLNNPKEILKANHYSNLQPMWAADNYSKGNRFLDK